MARTVLIKTVAHSSTMMGNLFVMVDLSLILVRWCPILNDHPTSRTRGKAAEPSGEPEPLAKLRTVHGIDRVNSSSDSGRTAKRRVFRFSLRLFLIVLVLTGVILGSYLTRVERQKSAVDWIRLRGGSVYFDIHFNYPHQFDNDGIFTKAPQHSQNGSLKIWTQTMYRTSPRYF